MICGSCGAASAFADITPRSQAVLDIFLSHGLQSHAMIDGKIEVIMPPRPAQPKTKFLYSTLTVYGDGSRTRSFCYVSDLIEALVAIMETENFIGPVNAENPKEFTILELAKKVIKLTKSSSKIVHKPLPPDNPVHRCPDISLAKRTFGWKPKVDLEEGLLKTIAYFKEKLGIK